MGPVSRPRLLDLFCGDGGAARGYQRAGFYVVGVDIKPRPQYAGDEFVRADALTFPLDGFDAIHASPPCQHYSIATAGAGGDVRRNHPALIAPIRKRLRASGLPYVIENVPLAPLINPTVLCGTMFDLTAIDADGQPLFLRRHRLFESNVALIVPRPCRCREWKARGWWIGGVYGGGRSKRWEARYVRRGGYTPHVAKRRELMGIDWMTLGSLNEAIPPAYTEHVGASLLAALRAAA